MFTSPDTPVPWQLKSHPKTKKKIREYKYKIKEEKRNIRTHIMGRGRRREAVNAPERLCATLAREIARGEQQFALGVQTNGKGRVTAGERERKHEGGTNERTLHGRGEDENVKCVPGEFPVRVGASGQPNHLKKR